MDKDIENEDFFGEVPEPYTNPNVNEYDDYTEKDLRHVFSQGEFSDWNEVISWLRDYGAHDNYLSPGKDKMILDDLELLRDNGVLFTNNSDSVYKFARENR